jgi:hypothetical protein
MTTPTTHAPREVLIERLEFLARSDEQISRISADTCSQAAQMLRGDAMVLAAVSRPAPAPTITPSLEFAWQEHIRKASPPMDANGQARWNFAAGWASAVDSITAAPRDKQRSDMVALLRDPKFTMSGGSEFALEIVAALTAAPDFDTWMANPYTKVLQKSIEEDYIPKGAAPAPTLTDAQIDAITDQQWGAGCLPNQYQAHRAFARAILRATPAEGSAVMEVLEAPRYWLHSEDLGGKRLFVLEDDHVRLLRQVASGVHSPEGEKR